MIDPLSSSKYRRVRYAHHLVGSAPSRQLKNRGYSDLFLHTLAELELRGQAAAQDFAAEKPGYATILAATKVGGIHANKPSLQSSFMTVWLSNQTLFTAHAKQCNSFIVFGLILHIPQRLLAAYEGIIPSNQPAGAKKSPLRFSQYRRY